MSEPEIRIFPNLDEMSAALAARFVAAANERSRREENFCAAVSGGQTPRPFFERLADSALSASIPWTRMRLFQVDERAVPPDHPQSNYGMLRRTLLDHVPAAAANFHRMEAERANLSVAAVEYEGVLARELRPPQNHVPRLDLILLGLGADGHTASLFPGTPAQAERERWVAPNFVPKLNMHRMTLTYPVLNAAAEVAFMVAGKEKSRILQEVLEGPRRPELFPAQGVQPASGRLVWYLDRAAAGRLSNARRSAP